MEENQKRLFLIGAVVVGAVALWVGLRRRTSQVAPVVSTGAADTQALQQSIAQGMAGLSSRQDIIAAGLSDLIQQSARSSAEAVGGLATGTAKAFTELMNAEANAFSAQAERVSSAQNAAYAALGASSGASCIVNGRVQRPCFNVKGASDFGARFFSRPSDLEVINTYMSLYPSCYRGGAFDIRCVGANKTPKTEMVVIQ